jgi:hypothetical protein
MKWRILVFYPEPEAKINHGSQDVLRVLTWIGGYQIFRFWLGIKY